MIISHKHKFIFIKTVKTAGTSIEVYLSQFCDEQDILTPIYPAVAPHQAQHYRGYWNPIPEMCKASTKERMTVLGHWMKGKKFRNHASAVNVKHRVPKSIWNNYFKFCVDRNPWDKTLSHYHMLRKRHNMNMTLDQYFANGKLCLNYPKYCDQRGNVLVDRVLNYEALDSQLGEVFKQLSIPFDGGLGVRAKGNYRDDHRPYQKVYTPEQQRFVAQAFSREIDMHAYVF
ncbi:sulfotransferase family 2 domain-containing protein [Alteromonas sp. C1M14]|uniref:sulfotransferase family 2 domain-containing protein n=1 Tax=Alteromonas sp. C1M14 TaxID=2841567 RepID=UPI001C081217|nr:sulfotransferase family 2 domain-containing protein [Alteromonas sp. C1M14]MBU2979580.1 sulfotransferase family 2 domain-containing protein [Alteromonas sp. C1M14]